MIPNVNRNASFKRSLNYAFKEGKRESSTTLLVDLEPIIVASNMAGTIPEELVVEFESVERLNHKAVNPVLSVSLALHFNEPTKTALEWQEIIEQFIRKMGSMVSEGEIGIAPERNQFVAVLHRDRPHQHVHLLLNRINVDGEICYCKWDQKRSQAVCRELEQEFGLAPVTGDSKHLFLSKQIIAMLEQEEKQTGKTSPQLERYRTERLERLKEWNESGRVSTDIECDSERNSTRLAGAGIGSSTQHPAPADSASSNCSPGRRFEQLHQQFEFHLRGHLDRLFGTSGRSTSRVQQSDSTSAQTVRNSAAAPESPGAQSAGTQSEAQFGDRLVQTNEQHGKFPEHRQSADSERIEAAKVSARQAGGSPQLPSHQPARPADESPTPSRTNSDDGNSGLPSEKLVRPSTPASRHPSVTQRKSKGWER